MRAVSHRTGRPPLSAVAEAKSFFMCEAFHMPRTIPHAIWPRSETMVHVPTPAFPSPLCFVFPRDFGPHSQRRLAHVPIATLPQVPGHLSHRAVLRRLHTLARQARGFELAPLIAGRARERRMFPTLQWFMFPAPLSPAFPTSPHPAHVPSARLAHVPVATSHDVRVDALLPLFSACRSRYSAGHSHCCAVWIATR